GWLAIWLEAVTSMRDLRSSCGRGGQRGLTVSTAMTCQRGRLRLVVCGSTTCQSMVAVFVPLTCCVWMMLPIWQASSGTPTSRNSFAVAPYRLSRRTAGMAIRWGSCHSVAGFAVVVAASGGLDEDRCRDFLR